MSESRIRTAINQSCFPVLSTAEFIGCVRSAGFGSVELRTLGRKESVSFIRNAVAENGVRVEAINGLMDWALPDDPDPQPALARAVEVAVAVGAPAIVCAAPIRSTPLPPPATVMASATERLAAMAEAARPSGVRLALEQVGTSSTRPGAASGIRKLDDALTIAAHAGGDVLITLDSYNLTTADESFETLGRVPLTRVAIAQVAGSAEDFPGRALPGEGHIDNRSFVRALVAMGYEGAVSIEMFPSTPWNDPHAFAAMAFTRLQTLMRDALMSGEETR